MLTNKLLKLVAISAVIFGAVSCKDEVASVGQKAPDIAAYDLQGNPANLENWKGTRLLIFWSETCGRCIAELKEFEKLAEENPGKVSLIAINVDSDKMDTKVVVAKRELHLPTSFVINPEGKIQAKYEGAIPSNDLDKLFKG